MDFQPQIGLVTPVDAPLPFFLAYPNYANQVRNKARGVEPDERDFEYLQRTYPTFVARMQKRVEEILDRMDYEGSMIYDEYPDRLSLQMLGEAVGRILSTEGKQDETTLEKAYLQGLAQVLTCNEIYRRRQKRKQGTNGRITTGFGRNPE